jgi:hypothetical protein
VVRWERNGGGGAWLGRRRSESSSVERKEKTNEWRRKFWGKIR